MNWLYSPPWSTRIIVAAALLLLALAAARWWRERRGASLLALRGLTVAALAWIALNPQALLPRERTGKPKLVLLIDTSASMATRDMNDETRLGAALRVLTNSDTLAKLEKEFIIESRRFDREIGPVDWGRLTSNDAGGDASNLGSALMTVVSQLGDLPSQAGVLVVSDGRATTPDTLEAAQLALARSVPLWTWTLGGRVPRRDLWIDTASSEALAFSGAEVELAATLRAAGYANRSFNVELRADDKLIETREVIPDTNGMARVSMRVHAPRSGEQRYVFRVPPQPDEADPANNERAVFVRAVGDKVRVLLAEGEPHWDTKFLVQSLKREPNVDLTAVYRLNGQRRLAVVSSTSDETRMEEDLFPRTAEAMNAFDVMVFGRGMEPFFDSGTESLMTEYISRRGGSIVFARGKPYGGRFQPLAKIEPVAWGSGVTPAVKLRLTEAGRANPIFDLGAAGTLDELLERLPALDQASVTLGEKPLAIVLAHAAGDEGPVVVAYQRYGQGKALSLNAGGLWRWSFRESGQDETEAAYRKFWVSLLQWLLAGSHFLPGADVGLTSARRSYTSEQPMQWLISTRNLDRAAYHPRITVSGGGRTVEVEPRAKGDVFVAEAGPFAPGMYQVTLRNNLGKPAELTQSAEVVSASVEKREVSADPGLMRQLAETSGGAVVTAADVGRLPEVVRQWEATRQLSHLQRPVWDRGWILGAVVLLLGAEWWLRRREGLL